MEKKEINMFLITEFCIDKKSLYSLCLNICLGQAKAMNMPGTYEAGIIILVPGLLPFDQLPAPAFCSSLN